jgi:hypothetical protein
LRSTGLLQLSTRFRRNRLIAVIAAIALIAAASLYSSHGVSDRIHRTTHCDLCVHLGGTAGSPAHTAVVGKPVLAVRVPTERPQHLVPARRKATNQLPRGPPLLETI